MVDVLRIVDFYTQVDEYMAKMLEEAGFQEISFLPFPHRWHPYEVIARKPE